MQETEYREAIKAYTDADGLVCHTQTKFGERGASGNGLLYTSIHMLNLFQNKWITEADKQKFSLVVDSCKVERFGWLLHRSPVKTDLNSHDDYTGVAAAFKIIGMPFHSASMLRDFKQRKWFLDNELPYDPRWKSWLGRMPDFVAHIYEAGGESAPFFNGIYRDICFNITPKTNDAWMLRYLKAKTSKSKHAAKFLEKCNGRKLVSDFLHNENHPLGKVFII